MGGGGEDENRGDATEADQGRGDDILLENSGSITILVLSACEISTLCKISDEPFGRFKCISLTSQCLLTGKSQGSPRPSIAIFKVLEM